METALISPPVTDPTPPATPPFRRTGRILHALLAVLVVVGLGPLATMAWKLIDINREALTTAHQQIELLMASSIAHELDAHVSSLRSQLLRVAQTFGTVTRSREVGVADIERLLDGVNQAPLRHARYTYFRGDGVVSVSSGALDPTLEPMFATALERVAELQVRSEGRQEGGGTLLSEPILTESGALLMIAAPVVSHGAFRGMLTGLIDMRSLWDGVAGRSSYTGYTVFALDAKGNLLASSDHSPIRSSADLEKSPLVERFLSAEGRVRETMPFELRESGTSEMYLGSFETTREGWGVFVQAQQRQVYLQVRMMVQSTLTWALIALGLAGLVAIVFARSLSNPVNRLAAASSAFARGDFSTRVQVRTRNEIGELAHTFNMMAAEIEAHIRRLRKAHEETNELFLGTIRALAQAIDAKDPYTQGHSVRVNRYSVILARQLGLGGRELNEIHVASLLHDVGKIGIDDAILKKPGMLTADEFKVMKTHPALGATIMAPIRQMQRMLPGLRWHHERVRGDGYPDGLAGDAIPLMARIIAVADTFDAITTRRPYQEPMSFERAIARINELKGTALDDKVVEAFNRACHAGTIRLEPSLPVEVAPPPEAVPAEA